MSTGHWSDEELIGRLYGVGPEDGHLEQCAECARRFEAVLEVRRQVLEPPAVSEQFLVNQRRMIRSRLAACAPRPGLLRIVPAAFAAAAVVLLAVVLYRPAPVPAPDLGIADSELYADVYSIVQSNEPLAVQPIHALFEVQE
jgi:hypothetical protein